MHLVKPSRLTAFHQTLRTIMLTKLVPRRCSAGVTVDGFVRNALGCVRIIAAAWWIEGVGVGSNDDYLTLCVVCLLLRSLVLTC